MNFGNSRRVFGHVIKRVTVPTLHKLTQLTRRQMTLFVFTDGGASKNGAVDCEASWAVYFSDQDPRNSSGKIDKAPSNQKAELFAILRALQLTIDDDDVTIVSDSQYAINCLTKWSEAWERKGWVTSKGEPVKHVEVIKESLELVRYLGDDFESDEPRVKFRHVNSHRKQPDPSNVQESFFWRGNDQADRMARRVLGR